MPYKRGSGVLLHITSLPSDDAIGNLGPGAHEFIDFLMSSGQSLWQVLPLNPSNPGEGNSPYSSSSAFAGNTLLISPEILAEQEWINKTPSSSDFPKNRVDFGAAIKYKNQVLSEAYHTFKQRAEMREYDNFCRENSYWLDDFALFISLKDFFNGESWSRWPDVIRDRKPEALNHYAEKLADPIRKQKFWQFLFYEQWRALKEYANNRQIKIMGDIPIYMSYQSADLWSHPEIFKLDQNKEPLYVAGVPPDYFSETGQLWGNPVYNWKMLCDTDFDWWIRRIKHNLKLFDRMRIDHFRGLAAYWQVPANETTAINGEWIEVPSDDFFRKLKEHEPLHPIVAEDLGLITPDVKELIAKLGIPGMKVLLFAFGKGLPTNPYAPHNHVQNCVVYTGTHDNNTVRGWYEHEATIDEKQNLILYLGHDIEPEDVHNVFIRLAMMSVADTIVIPIQDILGLGAKARMNIPSTSNSNWEWRLRPEQLTDNLAAKLRGITEIYGRLPERNQTRHQA